MGFRDRDGPSVTPPDFQEEVSWPRHVGRIRAHRGEIGITMPSITSPGFGRVRGDVLIEKIRLREADIDLLRAAAILRVVTYHVFGWAWLLFRVAGPVGLSSLIFGGVLNVRKGADLITVDLRTNKNAEGTGTDIARKIIERM